VASEVTVGNIVAERGKIMKILRFFVCCTFISLLALIPAIAGADTSSAAEYKLGPEDVIEISVWGDKDLIREVVVGPDGNISFPLVGDLKAGGLTVADVRKEIKKRISEYVPDAAITVILSKVISPKVFVMGKVKNPGVFILGQKMTVVQALSMSGGLSPFAESGSIIVVRHLSNGGQEAIHFDYDEIADGENLKSNIYLESGDTIIVP
jgi:polysaccharide export outer membrane protein